MINRIILVLSITFTLYANENISHTPITLEQPTTEEDWELYRFNLYF